MIHSVYCLSKSSGSWLSMHYVQLRSQPLGCICVANNKQGYPRMKTMAITLILVALGGCAVQKQLIPTGGSRADGTIELSYEFGEFQVPKIDLQQGAELARRRCAAWGYSDAEPFGGQKNTCQALGGFAGCARTLVTIQYQCIGANTPQ